MININDIEKIIEQRGRGKNAVIPILQAIQVKYNYLPQDALERVCETTDITASEIIGVASFYSQFRFEPAGKHIVKVCIGTACHVKGSSLVHDAFLRTLNITGKSQTDKSGTFTIEKVSCLGCCTLAPVVQIDGTTYGHVTSNHVDEVLHDFKNKVNNKPLKKLSRGLVREVQGEIRIGLGSCCVASGSEEVKKALENTLETTRLNVKIKHVGCVGMCHQVPLVEVVPANKESSLYARVKPEDVRTIVEKHFKPSGFIQRISNRIVNGIEAFQTDYGHNDIEKYSIDIREKHVHSFLGNQVPVATEFRGIINPLDIEEYESKGGFKALTKALKMQPHEVIEEMVASGIRGRGGAGFQTGLKWQMVANQNSVTKYIICNGDEGDPGAFMDRMLLESYPYRVIEGMLIAAHATGSTTGYFYIRAEYPLAVTRMKQALEICTRKNYTGLNILNTGFNFNIELYEGAGAFVCGEETALIASIEGKRGFPSLKPPFPASHGLWGKPTLVNNVETFAQVAYIIHHGSKHYASIGTENSRGTKVFALAGKINRGGLIEVPIGISIRKVVEEIGGGVANNKKFKAVQIGGPSGGCIPHWLADLPIDYHSLTEAGAMMGSGGMVVLDETDCMVDMAKYFLSFTQNESCGKCTFCRIGTRRMLDILERLCSGKAKQDDLAELETLAGWTKKGSLCGLGKTAPNPILSTLKYFHEEYEAHLNGVCPTGKCKDLITYSVNDNCIGCTKCSQDCPADAIPFTPHVKHDIDLSKCIKCDTCRQVCPVDAISVK